MLDFALQRHARERRRYGAYYLQSLLGKAVFGIDRRLQRRYGVFCYSSDPRCIFRISIKTLEAAEVLENGTEIARGSAIVELHLWNEQLPFFCGNSIAWALRLSRNLMHSLQLLSDYLARNPDFDDVQAIGGDMALGTAEQTAQLLWLAGKYGFSPCRPRPCRKASCLIRFGENIFISMMVLARNVKALRLSSIRRNRVRVLLTRFELDRRFGRGAN